VINYAHIVKTL